MLKKKFYFREHNVKMFVTVKVFDTKQQMEDYCYENWDCKDKQFEREPHAYFKSLIFTKIKDGEEVVRKKIGEITLNKEKICYTLIAHECLHATIYFYNRMGKNSINFNSEEFEEEFCGIHQNLFYDIICWLRDKKIKLDKHI